MYDNLDYDDSKVKQESQRVIYHAPENNVPPFWRIDQDGHYYLLIDLQNTN